MAQQAWLAWQPGCMSEALSGWGVRGVVQFLAAWQQTTDSDGLVQSSNTPLSNFPLAFLAVVSERTCYTRLEGSRRTKLLNAYYQVGLRDRPCCTQHPRWDKSLAHMMHFFAVSTCPSPSGEAVPDDGTRAEEVPQRSKIQAFESALTA